MSGAFYAPRSQKAKAGVTPSRSESLFLQPSGRHPVMSGVMRTRGAIVRRDVCRREALASGGKRKPSRFLML